MAPEFVIDVYQFWGILAFLMLIASLCYSNSIVLGFFVAVGLMILALFVGPTADAFSWVINNPFLTFGAVVAYFIVGGVYSIGKWKLYLSKPEIQDQIKKSYKLYVDKAQYNWSAMKKNPPKGELIVSEFVAPTIDEFIDSTDNPMRIIHYKSRILTWITFWAFSGIWTFTYELVQNIYNYLSKIYTGIMKKVINDVLKG